MRSFIVLAISALIVSSCSIMSPSLYYWGGTLNGTTTYENLAYRSYDKQTPESICRLVCAYEDMVSHPSGSRTVPPPGICAEYGYLLLQPGTAEAFLTAASPVQKKVFSGTDYSVIFSSKGIEMMQREMELYPESIPFIKPLLERLSSK